MLYAPRKPEDQEALFGWAHARNLVMVKTRLWHGEHAWLVDIEQATSLHTLFLLVWGTRVYSV